VDENSLLFIIVPLSVVAASFGPGLLQFWVLLAVLPGLELKNVKSVDFVVQTSRITLIFAFA